MHQKYISLSTAGQNKCLFCRNSYLGIQPLPWCQCKSRWIPEGEEKRKRAPSAWDHIVSVQKRRRRERGGGGGWEREREMRMRGSLGEVLTKGRKFVVAGHRPLTRLPTRRQTPYLDLFRPPTYSWKSEHSKNVSNCFTKKWFLQIADAVCCDIDCSKVLSSRENAHNMLEMAGKCSNYARNWGLCFSFWIMPFEADYAKNYASILYQCLVIWRVKAFRDQQCQFLTRNKSLSSENESNCSMTSECVRTDLTLPRGAGLEHGRCKQSIFSLSIFGILVERLSF